MSWTSCVHRNCNSLKKQQNLKTSERYEVCILTGMLLDNNGGSLHHVTSKVWESKKRMHRSRQRPRIWAMQLGNSINYAPRKCTVHFASITRFDRVSLCQRQTRPQSDCLRDIALQSFCVYRMWIRKCIERKVEYELSLSLSFSLPYLKNERELSFDSNRWSAFAKHARIAACPIPLEQTSRLNASRKLQENNERFCLRRERRFA